MKGVEVRPGFNTRKAFRLQRLLAERVIWEGQLTNIRYVCGLDLSYVGDIGIAVATLHDYPDLALIKYSVVAGFVPIPYVPGLLAFREAPLMFKAVEKLGVRPDLIVVDGHGVTHPRGLGIASHIGVVLDVPSVGAAKRILTGEVVRKGGREYLVVKGRVGALIVRSKGRRTVYLSIGHKVSMNDIERLSRVLFKGHSLPEPTYVADRITKEVRKAVKEGSWNS